MPNRPMLYVGAAALRDRGEQREREALRRRTGRRPSSRSCPVPARPSTSQLPRSTTCSGRRNTTRNAGRPDASFSAFAVGVDLLRARAEPGRVRAARTELVATGDDEAVVVDACRADRAEHARVDAARVGVEHRLGGFVARVDRGEARRRGVRHRRPTGRAVGVRELLEHRERVLDAGLGAAELARHEDPEQLRVGERVDDRLASSTTPPRRAPRPARSTAAARGPCRRATTCARSRLAHLDDAEHRTLRVGEHGEAPGLDVHRSAHHRAAERLSPWRRSRRCRRPRSRCPTSAGCRASADSSRRRCCSPSSVNSVYGIGRRASRRPSRAPSS